MQEAVPVGEGGTAPQEALAEKLRRVLQPRPEIREAYLFGSGARGQAGPLSDVDVAVTVDPALISSGSFGYEAMLAAELMAALGSSRVDLVLLHRAPPLLYHRVLRDGVRLFARDLRETTRREGQALSRFCDDVPRLERLAELQDERLRSGRFGR